MSKQKFRYGDHVRVKKDQVNYMSHFASDVEAIVLGSYKDQYGGNDTKSYTLYINGEGEVSWYYDHQLELIEKGRSDLLEKWVEDADIIEEQELNLDWIFANGEKVLKEGTNGTVIALAECLGLTEDDLWGSRGEGIVFATRAVAIISAAAPFLLLGDKKGWLDHCEGI